MTQKLLLRATVLACAMLLGMTLQAQVKVYNPMGLVDPNVVISSSTSQPWHEQAFEKTQKAIAKVKAEGMTLNIVTLNLTYDENLFLPPVEASFACQEDYGFGALSIDEHTLQAEVPYGAYDIICCFQPKNEHTAVYFVIKEHFEITSDTTITLNPDDCVNRIAFREYGPDGEPFKLGLGHWDMETFQPVIDEEGSIDVTTIDNYVYIKGNLFNYGGGVTKLSPQIAEDERYSNLDVFVNDVSDRFLFAQSRISYSNDLTKSYCTWLSTDNVKVGEISNNPDEYVLCQDTYKYTPYGQTKSVIGSETAIVVCNKGYSSSRSALLAANVKPRLSDTYTNETYVNIPDRDPYYSQLELLIQTDYPDYEGIVTDSWGNSQLSITGISFGTPLSIKNGRIYHTNIGHCDNEGGISSIYSELHPTKNYLTLGRHLLPAPEAFSYPIEQKLGIINDNCPINAMQVRSFKDWDNLITLSIKNFYVGRYGETRWCNEGVSAQFKRNGEVLETPAYNRNELYEWEIIVKNPNIEVDGLPGHNTTTVYFDQNLEDNTPPAVEMLHFRSEEGVTDCFATAADGTIEFYASDFNYQYYPELWGGVFQCQPVEVTVEYAPYGTEAWNELAVEEIPELYQEPGWGYFYRGSLAGVTGEGLNGWFDLRFRLQDASGNWMDQVVSPAFRIDDQAYSSVATVTADKGGDDAIYNLAGQRMRGDLNSLPHGIYIVGGKKVVK